LLYGLLGLLIAWCVVGAGQAHAARVPRTSIGVNVKPSSPYPGVPITPGNISLASKAGVGVARTELDQGTDADPFVRWLAEAHLRLYPVLGLPCPPGTQDCTWQTEIPPATAAGEMAQYVTAFAKRYGANGTFWSQNPGLPYEPVTRFEIGNEPNIRVIWIEDGTHLHWANPSDSRLADMADYAEVYEASRSALHAVDPHAIAVVGGLADSASYGADVESDESLLSALPRGGVDAVAYHPWVFDVSDALLKPDTVQLRHWMDRHGFTRVPIDVNEFGACDTNSTAVDNSTCPRNQGSATWGSAATAYSRWALCTSWLHVKDLQSFVWGDTALTAEDVWLPMFAPSGAETPFGQDFLTTTKALTTSGCPRPPKKRGIAPRNRTAPAIRGVPSSGRRLSSSAGKWTGAPKPAIYYQWNLCDPAGRHCQAIYGADHRTYALVPGDVGSTIAVLVTAINRAGGSTATGRHTVKILPAGQVPAKAKARR
jgi:hypothetical protein